MIISNCSSSGADSYANPVTGVVSRKDELTGQTVPASIHANGIPQDADTKPIQAVNAITLSTAALSVVLGTQEV